MFNKFLASDNKLLEITIGGTHQDNTLIDLGPIDSVMSHGIAAELHEIVSNPLASLGLVALLEINNTFRVVVDSYHVRSTGV